MPHSTDHIQARGYAGPDHLPPDLRVLATLKSAGYSIFAVQKNITRWHASPTIM
tara:strand:+ start:1646 stop:1807 length:162 start_codon:yes stop_codon:yes gene_type:complete